MDNSEVVLFESKPIRKVWHQDEWFFSVIDVIAILTESANPRKYWNTLKTREPQLSSICGQLKMLGADHKFYKTDAAHTEGILRILMAVPSPKAEPFKLWLAHLGQREIQETENPELGFERLRDLYKIKGYPNDWIETRMRSLDVRKQLTEEWQKRKVKQGQEFAILTALIAKGTFGLTPTEHKDLKGLSKPTQNLRDHMTPLELIFTALGEETTRQLAIKEDAQGFDENKDKATKGGQTAGDLLETYEQKTGLQVISTDNFLAIKKLDTPELPFE